MPFAVDLTTIASLLTTMRFAMVLTAMPCAVDLYMLKKEEVQMKLRALGLMKYFLINLIKILTQREYLQSKLDKLTLQIL